MAAPAKSPLCLLSLDGGGVRGYSELVILDELMLKVQKQKKLDEPPKPCDLFDLICGTSTGGIIALMLGRLKMTVQETMRVYEQVSIEIFGKPKGKLHFSEGRFSATSLESIIKRTIQQFGERENGNEKADSETKLLKAQGAADECKVTALALDTTRLFRSYRDLSAEQYVDVTIWQAARATSAAPTFFKSLKIGPANAQESFLDGGLGSNNPTEIMMNEAYKAFDGTRDIACIVSIGTGLKGIGNLKDPDLVQKAIPLELIKAMVKTVTDCEAVAKQVAGWFREKPGVYFRFNVEQGLEDIRLEDAKELGNLKTKTIRYIQQERTANSILEVTSLLCNPTVRALRSSLRIMLSSPENKPQPNPLLQDCLRSLSFPEMNHRFNGIESATKGTCEWLPQHTQYKKWATWDRSLLWIKGKPGSGKSTLLRHALDKIREAPNFEDTDFILSFFIHGRGDTLQKTPLGLFRSLLFQILHENPLVFDYLPHCLDSYRKWHSIKQHGEVYEWHFSELQRFFESSLLKVLERRSVWLFVDALDESGEENATDIFSAFKSLLQTPSLTEFNFRICFSCRQYPIIDKGSASEVCVDQENKSDIAKYVRDRLEVSPELLSSDIPNMIIGRARGIFMWVRLVLDRVLALQRKRRGVREIKKVLDAIPQKLDELYDELLRNMDDKLASLRMIEWICFALRPLRLEELRWAMIVDPICQQQSLADYENEQGNVYDSERMNDMVKVLTFGLAEVIQLSQLPEGEEEADRLVWDMDSLSDTAQSTEVVQWIHLSVRDYFLDKGLSVLHDSLGTIDVNPCEPGNPKDTENRLSIRDHPFVDRKVFNAGHAHYNMSRTCIRYLTTTEVAQIARIEDRLHDFIIVERPFLLYAANSWIPHARQSDAMNVSQDDLVEYVTWPPDSCAPFRLPSRDGWDPYRYDPLPNAASILHVVSEHQLMGPLRRILQTAAEVRADINAWDDYGRTPLSLAAFHGKEAVVRLLLKQGGIEADLQDFEDRTPLSYAAGDGHESIVKLLLKWGDVEADSVDILGRTPLSYAAGDGHESIVKLLLKWGDVEADSADILGRTPLSYAAEDGHESIVKLLLEWGDVEADSADILGRTPLSYTAENGHIVLAKLFLNQNDINVNSMDEKGCTPLGYAAKETWNRQMVQILLELGKGRPKVVG
ncbi:MAG: hypothetical protein M1814_003705 [Vezdaea aestivalis]|nr:MAG: hypothetical protein M1814_003705 [Vezdaea aestivalis]